ncbi:hypothetical protein [Burkholderia gladioli]|uniref:hypothetical protein n=1 Tax=Burkholderia gladioli TaxID=28095 RepID=UPI0016408629|nr:hypothetical protein [Burkholderia gladioli]
MKKRPILFSAPMVRAILDGRKTQTRRVAKEFAGRDNLDAILRRFPNQQGCPHGEPGDRLWVRETWGQYQLAPEDIVYRADEDFPCGSPKRWRPSIHMPRWASRITLEITGVRVERLQDISEADAIAEGIEHTSDGFSVDEGRHFHAARARDSFASLWDGLNEARGHGWEANPWVWVIEFRRITTEDGK